MTASVREPQAGPSGILVWGGLWLVLLVVAQATRPLLPIDETRYLAVAWDMWQRGDFLVPHLNGLPYSQKPPLMFWLIDAGWAVFGVHEWWARCVAPLFALGCLALTGVLARRLWPETPGAARLAPFILISSPFWAVFTTLTMFDPILTCFALVGLLGIVAAWQGRLKLGFAALGVAIGLGILTKGPVILLHVLPVALLAPWWGADLDPDTEGGKTPSKVAWYGGLAAAVAVGAFIGLAWAIPAAEAGGDAYAQAILWRQSAGRVVHAFAHRRAWWWYLPILPALALPWLVWPPVWRAALAARGARFGAGVRFCLAWVVPAFVIFSAISGKQPHYLLPELPALALLAAHLVTADGLGAKARPGDWVPPAIVLGVLAAVIAGFRWFPYESTAVTNLVRPAWAVLIIAAAAALWATRRRPPRASVLVIAGAFVFAVVTTHLAAYSALKATYDLTPIAERLGAWQRAGHPLANYGKYHGQFQFLGRLEAPMTILGSGEAPGWVAAHPNGKIVSYHDDRPHDPDADLVVRYRGKWIAVWPADAVAADPSVLSRR